MLTFTVTINGNNSFSVSGDIRIPDVRPELTRWFETLDVVQQVRIDAITRRLKASNDRLDAVLSTHKV